MLVWNYDDNNHNCNIDKQNEINTERSMIGMKEWGEICLSHVTPNLEEFSYHQVVQFFNIHLVIVMVPEDKRDTDKQNKSICLFPVYSSTVKVGPYKSCPKEVSLGVLGIAS